MGWGTFTDVQHTKRTARETTAFVIAVWKLPARLSLGQPSLPSGLRGSYFPNTLSD